MPTMNTAPAAPPPGTPPRPARPVAPTIWRVDDALWDRLAPLLVIDQPRQKPGRPRRDDRAIFDGLIWLARTGAQWAASPTEFGPKSTVHRRFQEWVARGVFARAGALLLAEYEAVVGLDWDWLAADGCLVKAPGGKKGRPGRRPPRGATPRIAANRAPNGIC